MFSARRAESNDVLVEGVITVNGSSQNIITKNFLEIINNLWLDGPKVKYFICLESTRGAEFNDTHIAPSSGQFMDFWKSGRGLWSGGRSYMGVALLDSSHRVLSDTPLIWFLWAFRPLNLENFLKSGRGLWSGGRSYMGVALLDSPHRVLLDTPLIWFLWAFRPLSIPWPIIQL